MRGKQEARGESEDMGPADQAEAAADTTLPEGGGCAAESEESRSAAQHAKERRAAARWLATEPFGYLMPDTALPKPQSSYITTMHTMGSV